MGKKGKKTRWRRLPIGGTDEESGLRLEAPAPTQDSHRVTFNEDEYTKITTPRQDVLFKKGYFGRKRTPPDPSPSESQEVHSGDSVENESYMSEEPQYAYPAGYMDPTGVYYVNGNTFETYDPYTGTVTVVVGPPPQYAGAPPVLAALPCQPVPLQPVEWFNPAAPWCYSYNRRKRYSTDSQNCSAQSSESTGPPGSPQEPMDEGACAMYPPPPNPHPHPQYVYPGYMFGPPIYNMNGVTVQGMIPQPVPLPPDPSVNKRRKKRRRKRRGGVTDDGSESSCCEEPLTCDVIGCQSETSQSGASSDAGLGPNSDSGINTNSGSNSPPLVKPEKTQHELHGLDNGVIQESHILPLCSNEDQSVDECVAKNNEERCSGEATTPEIEVSEELSAAEDDVTPNLCAAAPEFSSQESTLSCLSTPSATRDLLPNEQEMSNTDVSQEEIFESCYSISSLPESCMHDDTDNLHKVSPCRDTICESVPQICSEPLPVNPNDDLITCPDENVKAFECVKETLSELEMPAVDFTLELQSLVVDAVLDSTVEILETSTNSESDKDTEVADNQVTDKSEITRKEIEVIESSICQEEELDNSVQGKVENEEQVNKLVNMSEIKVSQDEVEAIVNHQEEENKVTICQWEESNEETVDQEEEIKEEVTQSLCFKTSATNFETVNHDFEDPISRLLSHSGTLAPVPPPRRKRSMSRAADRIATKVVEEAIREGVEEASRVRLNNPMSITEAVTRWLNSHESSPLTYPALDSESDNDDEGIVVEEGLTGQKNVQGNPFLASSHSDAGKRVANDCESVESSAGEWDMWDHSHTRDMCDPTRSVDKYYRLGADEGVGDKVPPSIYKTAMHIRHTGPFPCGVCCIIQ